MMRFIRAFAIAATLMTTQTTGFEVQEATIADIHAALASRRITCAQLVRKYLDRIGAYDKKGPAINSVITVNAKALDEARAIDVEIARAGIIRPLQCIPVAVKDNFETIGLPTTAGSLSLAGWISNRDAIRVSTQPADRLLCCAYTLRDLCLTPGDESLNAGNQSPNAGLPHCKNLA